MTTTDLKSDIGISIGQPAVIVRGTSDVPQLIPQTTNVSTEPVRLSTILGSEQLTLGGLPRIRNKVAIVGFAPSSMEDVRHVWNDPDMEVWGINQLYMALPAIAEKATRWFQIHHRHSYDACVERDHSHHGWLAKQNKFPIYMQKKEPDIPMSIKFPVIDILQKFRRYFTNSISWELAVAIIEGFKEVHLYGVDMAQDCIAPETKILTADLRWIPAGEIKVGDKIIGFDENSRVTDGHYREWQCAVITQVAELKKPCYAVTFADGTTIVASEKHGWLTASHRWITTGKFRSKKTHDGHTTKIIKTMNVWDIDRSKDAGYLAGAFDAEGHISQKPHRNYGGKTMAIGFGQNPNAMSNQVEESLKRKKFNFGKCKHGNLYNYVIHGGRSELLRFLGQIRPPRLLENFKPGELGVIKGNGNHCVEVVKCEFIGEQTVIGLNTTTKTFVAEGFLNHNSEYAFERPSVEYFLGYAEGAGVKLVLPDKCDLCKSLWLYPFEDDVPFRAKLMARRQELRERLNQSINQESMGHDTRLQILGALDDLNYIEKTWGSAAKDLEGPGFIEPPK